MALIRVNMNQFRKQFVVYADNCGAYEAIKLNKGVFHTLNVDLYKQWLNEFNIFYTITF